METQPCEWCGAPISAELVIRLCGACLAEAAAEDAYAPDELWEENEGGGSCEAHAAQPPAAG